MVVIGVFLVFALLMRAGGRLMGSGVDDIVPGNAVLHLEMEGIILNGKKFLERLKKYGDDEKIKAVLVGIDSPGGAVGPSQEINAAFRRIREKRKIPVVCFTTGLMASGAYYAAVGCDKIVVSSGSLVGSIGVIMQFANMERLYDWAKVSRFSITTGRYKDSGAEYRSMREDERTLFQDLINEVHGQFKAAIEAGRPNLSKKILEEYSDGRVFTGAKAVELGFADSEGGYEEALKVAAEMAGLDENPEVFKPTPHRRFWFDWREGEDDLNSLLKAAKDFMGVELMNRPLFLMPGALGETN